MKQKLKLSLKFVKGLFTFSDNRLRDTYYDSIEVMPVLYWWKIQETGDVSYLLKKRRRVNGKEGMYLLERWKELHNEYIQKYGFGEKFLFMLKKKKNIARLLVDRIIKEEKHLNTFIEIEELELKSIQRELSIEVDYMELKVMVEKFMGFAIDIKNTSVTEFQGYINSFKKRVVNG